MSFARLTIAPSCGKATGRDKTKMTHLVIGNLLMTPVEPLPVLVMLPDRLKQRRWTVLLRVVDFDDTRI